MQVRNVWKFLGATKPWLINFDEAGRALIGDCEKHCHGHLQLWWQIFNNMVRPLLNRKVTDSRDGDKSVSYLRLIDHQI